MLTQKRLKELLYYDPNTGIFTWRVKTSHRICIGSEAGCINREGYRQIGIEGKLRPAHRLAWLFVYGYFPEHGIDHINRKPGSNQISNLREASQSCNMRNCGNRVNNTSGITGVSWDKQSNKWNARIRINQKAHNLGRYFYLDDAICARLAAEQCVDWSNCNSSSPAYQYVEKNILNR